MEIWYLHIFSQVARYVTHVLARVEPQYCFDSYVLYCFIIGYHHESAKILAAFPRSLASEFEKFSGGDIQNFASTIQQWMFGDATLMWMLTCWEC